MRYQNNSLCNTKLILYYIFTEFENCSENRKRFSSRNQNQESYFFCHAHETENIVPYKYIEFIGCTLYGSDNIT